MAAEVLPRQFMVKYVEPLAFVVVCTRLEFEAPVVKVTSVLNVDMLLEALYT